IGASYILREFIESEMLTETVGHRVKESEKIETSATRDSKPWTAEAPSGLAIELRLIRMGNPSTFPWRCRAVLRSVGTGACLARGGGGAAAGCALYLLVSTVVCRTAAVGALAVGVRFGLGRLRCVATCVPLFSALVVVLRMRVGSPARLLSRRC